MPGLNNTIHSTTIAGQIFNRSVNTFPTFVKSNFVRTTMNNFSMFRRIRRFDKSHRVNSNLY
jgi:hypothetical protein